MCVSPSFYQTNNETNGALTYAGTLHSDGLPSLGYRPAARTMQSYGGEVTASKTQCRLSRDYFAFIVSSSFTSLTSSISLSLSIYLSLLTFCTHDTLPGIIHLTPFYLFFLVPFTYRSFSISLLSSHLMLRNDTARLCSIIFWSHLVPITPQFHSSRPRQSHCHPYHHHPPLHLSSSHHPQTIKAFQGVLQYPKLFANDMCHISYCICIYSSTAARPSRPRILNSHVHTCPYHDSVLRLSFHRLSIRSPVAPSTAALSLCVALTTLSFSSSAHSAMKVEVSETYPVDRREVGMQVHIS